MGNDKACKLHDASHGVVTAEGSSLTLVGKANVLVSLVV